MMPASDSPSRSVRLRRVFLFALIAGGIGWAATGLLFVDETELVIVERFGAVAKVYDRDEDRGLHFKWPWPMETARRFDRRVQLLNLPSREILTQDKKNITLDAYICWRIAPADSVDPPTLNERPTVRFFRALGDKDIAAARLESRFGSALSARFGRVELDRLLDVHDSEQGPGAEASSLLDELAEQVRQDAAENLPEQLGIEVVTVGFQRLNFPEGNRSAVYERMRSERRKIADRYRAEGRAESQLIRSQAEFWARDLLARANAEAEKIQGEAEAEATRILNAAHLRDPEFYRVMRALKGYRRIIHPNTTLVLSASSQLLKLMTEGLPPTETTPNAVTP